MSKIDLKKDLKTLYQPSAKDVSQVDVPAMHFMMIDGAGDPNTSKDFRDAVEALYGVSYTLKFMLKKRGGFNDWGVMPLEGLWWTDDMSRFSMDEKDRWKWTVMIMQPEFITEDHVREASAELAGKKNPIALPRLRFERFCEGFSAQIMHIGPYSAEGPTVALLHDFIRKTGHTPRGKHHEIYLSDPGRTAPEKLKTIIRQPFG